MDVDILENAEKWAWNVAVKKGIAAVLGFVASQQALTGLAWLSAHGITITIDQARFKESFTILGVAGFALAHDYLRLRFPESKWL